MKTLLTVVKSIASLILNERSQSIRRSQMAHQRLNPLNGLLALSLSNPSHKVKVSIQNHLVADSEIEEELAKTF